MAAKSRRKAKSSTRTNYSRYTSYRINSEIWSRVQNASAAEGRTLNGLVADALERYRHLQTAKTTGSVLRPEEASAMRRLAHEARESFHNARQLIQPRT